MSSRSPSPATLHDLSIDELLAVLRDRKARRNALRIAVAEAEAVLRVVQRTEEGKRCAVAMPEDLVANEGNPRVAGLLSRIRQVWLQGLELELLEKEYKQQQQQPETTCKQETSSPSL